MRFLYRYYSNLEHVIDTIANKRLYFSPPSDFNDPYDCRPKFSLRSCKNNPDEVWNRYFFILAKIKKPKITDDEAQKHADAEISKKSHKNHVWLREADEALAECGPLANICCFSKSPRNAMMWAHYANEHKGVVLQFNAADMLDQQSGEYKGFDVEYYPQPITLTRYVEAMEDNLKDDTLALARLLYCSKSQEWAGEEEVRFFSQCNKLVPYREDMLTGILFGSRCPASWQETINTLLSTWNSKPKFFKEDGSVNSLKLCFRSAQQSTLDP